jgi:hypothetical protein
VYHLRRCAKFLHKVPDFSKNEGHLDATSKFFFGPQRIFKPALAALELEEDRDAI